MLGVFCQIAFHIAGGWNELPFDHADILASADHVVPVMLHGFLGLGVLGEHHQAGGMLVEAVHDKDLVALILALEIFAQDGIGCSFLYAVGAYRQQSVALVYAKVVVVLVDDDQLLYITVGQIYGDVGLLSGC